MRLIDADALIEATDGISQDPTCPMHIAAEYYQYMTEAPTIEAEPVRHGRGVDNHCSECGEMPMGTEAWESLGIEPPRFEWFMDFCPCCGAKMRGDTDGQA